MRNLIQFVALSLPANSSGLSTFGVGLAGQVRWLCFRALLFPINHLQVSRLKLEGGAGAASVMAPAVANPAYMGYKVLYRTVLDKVGALFPGYN